MIKLVDNLKGDDGLTKEKNHEKKCTCTEESQKCNCKKEEESLNKEVDSLKDKLNEQKDKFLRLAAEYDNYRKRSEKDRLTIYRDAKADTISALLPIADSIEIAIKACKDMNSEYQKGLLLIQNQLQTSLEKLNVASFGEVNEEFNPDLHNAIAHVENPDLAENVIEEVFQKGYKIEDKIIRHAMVRVAN